MTGFGRFLEIMAAEPEKEPDNPVEIGTLGGEIEFENVCFSYKSKDNPGSTKVIKDLSLKIRQGRTVAFVGPSGGGKTTLCHLIPRFYEIDSGAIKIDGIDITCVNRKDLRRNVGIVAQDVFLFAGSIKDNIGYGRLGATDDEIIEAAKRANIHDFAMSLPNGYNTEVGERGVKLSGGQKQRISIARAFLKNPPILILDEATSALDNITEMQIQTSLEELSKGRTTIIVAHRLSTVKNADEILVLTANGITERGTHTELMEMNGFYSHLYSFYN
ncbi:atp-binding cassette sub-family b [Holotrichia oblita]|nr:atp-binding cassette sub-family b [Holotrichia oblita]